jgi:hypothetical protein
MPYLLSLPERCVLGVVLETSGLGLGSMMGGAELASAESEHSSTLTPPNQVMEIAARQQGLDESRPSPFLPSSLSATPSSHLRSQIPSTSRNPSSLSRSPGARSSQGEHAWVATLPPIVDSSPVPRFQELSEKETETHLSPKLPAAHLIGKALLGLNQRSNSPRMTVLQAHSESLRSAIPGLGFPASHHLLSPLEEPTFGLAYPSTLPPRVPILSSWIPRQIKAGRGLPVG